MNFFLDFNDVPLQVSIGWDYDLYGEEIKIWWWSDSDGGLTFDGWNLVVF